MRPSCVPDAEADDLHDGVFGEPHVAVEDAVGQPIAQRKMHKEQELGA